MMQITARPSTKFLNSRQTAGPGCCSPPTSSMRPRSMTAFGSEESRRTWSPGDAQSLARARVIDDFRKGRLRALVNVMVLTTGFDAPATDCLVSMRPTLSAGLWLQMCGRGMRNAEGRRTAWYSTTPETSPDTARST